MSNFQKLVKPFVTTSTHKVDVYDLSDATYFIFIIEGYVLAPNSLMGTLSSVQEKERVDVNGASIIPLDYIMENNNGNSVLVKFIKANFPYTLDATDDIRVTGMFKHIPH
jgi:hypothetical protein